MSDIENLRCDVAVIGGGIAGMVTATRAAQGGAHVLVFERSPEDRYLCNSRLTAGIFHCALNSVTTPPTDLERYIYDATSGTAEPEQANAVASDALSAVRWLQAQGLRFLRGAQGYHDFTLAPPTLNPQNREPCAQPSASCPLLETPCSSCSKAPGQYLPCGTAQQCCPHPLSH